MSPDFEAFDRTSQAYVERFFWPLIGKAGAFVRKQKYPCFVADSTAIRAHVGFARDVGDIDFVFSSTCDEYFTVNAALHTLEPIDHELTKTYTGNILFARLKLPLEIAYRQERAFIVDLHFGGLVYKGQYSWRPGSDEVFKQAKWMSVNDLSGELTAELPVLPLPHLLALKLEKDIGRDECDILAGLTAETLIVDTVCQCVFHKAEATAVVARILNDLDNAFERFCLCYGPVAEQHRSIIEERLMKLMRTMKEENESV